MSKVEEYRHQLRSRSDWQSFLLAESHLPGPRGNIELGQAVAEEGDEALFLHLLSEGPRETGPDSPKTFLAFCGTLGLGRLLAEGRIGVLQTLRELASDPRWRIREGVAMALQRLGEKDMGHLLDQMEDWSHGSLLEQRAAAASLCEPKLLVDPEHIARVLQILDQITASLLQVVDRKGDEFRALRKGLGYCWSVAVAALPTRGKPVIEKWFSCADRDVRWIMKENLKKNRLLRMDATWVERSKVLLGSE